MIYIGKIVNTHGIKGEVKIKSNIKHKDLVFKKNNIVRIDNDNLTINTYRVHKDFGMLTFKEIENINDVLKYKGKELYIEKNQIDESILFDEDYIGLEVYSDRYIGVVENIISNNKQDILVVKNEDKEYLIPLIDEFIKSVDEKIIIEEIDGLIDEN